MFDFNKVSKDFNMISGLEFNSKKQCDFGETDALNMLAIVRKLNRKFGNGVTSPLYIQGNTVIFKSK